MRPDSQEESANPRTQSKNSLEVSKENKFLVTQEVRWPAAASRREGCDVCIGLRDIEGSQCRWQGLKPQEGREEAAAGKAVTASYSQCALQPKLATFQVVSSFQWLVDTTTGKMGPL